MSYAINLTNGTQLFELSDGVIDKTHSSVSLVGKNSVNFGDSQNENFVHILENFANSSSPIAPLTGQLWYDTASRTLTVYRNGNWDPLSTISYASTAPPTPAKANLWFDTTVNQLKIHDGTNFNVIGPEAVAGFGKTKMSSESLKDASGGFHPVIKCTLNGITIGVLSADSFDVAFDNSIDGIPHVYSGLTMKSGYSITGTTSVGSKSNTLLGADGTNYRSSSILADNSTIVERDSASGISVKKLTASELYSNSGIISGNWGVSGSVNPLTDFGASLGTANLHWSTIYTDNINAGSVDVNTKISSPDASIDTLKFKFLTDSLNTTVSIIDKDASLQASSDSRLSTQKAIKSYIDAQLASLVTTLNTTNSNLQTQISAISNVPTGTVLYYAGSTAPAGYLVADGSVISRSTYYNLWLALGGTASPYGQTLQTFTLPDLRGEFIRGLDNGRGVDTGRTLGSNQASQNLAHTHSYTLRSGGYNPWWQYTNAATVSDNLTATTGVSGGNESRPRNVALLPIIKT